MSYTFGTGRSSSTGLSGLTSTASSRMPTQPSMSGPNMTANVGLTPIPPAAPQKPKITEDITDQYYNKEKTKRGMLSTLLGRDTELSSNIRRRNELSDLLV